jgi:CheY-like chemotaxis protein
MSEENISSKYKIVIIDDEGDLLFLMKGILDATGRYQVYPTMDGEEGLRLCQEESPDLVIVDFIMPKENGDKLIDKLRNHPKTKAIPIVLMSGLGEVLYFDCLDEKEGFKQVIEMKEKEPHPGEWDALAAEVAKIFAVEDYLPKPFSKQRLLDMVESVLVGSRKSHL